MLSGLQTVSRLPVRPFCQVCLACQLLLSDLLRQTSGPASSVLLSHELQSFMITLVAYRESTP